MTKTFRIMTSEHGDKELVFTGTADTDAAAKEAKALFDKVLKDGGTVLNVKPGEPAQRITKFDQIGEEAIAIPRIVGG